MNKYSSSSAKRLVLARPEMQETFLAVLPIMDNTILETFRNEQRQNKMFKSGKSKVQWPNGAHNKDPSDAVDAAPWPIDWDDITRFVYFGGLVVATGYHLGHIIRWGGNWDSDDIIMHDQTFQDLVHFEYEGPV